MNHFKNGLDYFIKGFNSIGEGMSSLWAPSRSFKSYYVHKDENDALSKDWEKVSEHMDKAFQAYADAHDIAFKEIREACDKLKKSDGSK